MGEGPDKAGEGRTERQGRGLGEGWRRGDWREVMDPAEGEETGGAVPSLGGRGQLDLTEGWFLFQPEGMRR